MDGHGVSVRTHSDQQGRNGSAAFLMDHGEKLGEVAFSGSGEKQPDRQTDGRRDGPELRADRD